MFRLGFGVKNHPASVFHPELLSLSRINRIYLAIRSPCPGHAFVVPKNAIAIKT